MRINKYIAQAGVASRRKADELIKNGQVRVNGQVMRTPGFEVSDEDEVLVNGKPIEVSHRKVYYMMNKPTGVITSVKDEQGRMTVMDLMPEIQERVFPVGRLDYNTSGLLIMTNDGEMAYRIAHPKHRVGKVYRVRISGNINKEKLARLRSGVDIGGFVTSRARVDVIVWTKHSTVLEIEIHEGKNRQVRRMFKAVGCEVQELQRISIGRVHLGHLKPGTVRRLNPQEIEFLMNL